MSLVRILIVDDASFMRNLLVRALKSSNHQIETAVDGQEALEKWIVASCSDQPYAVLFVDLNMPRMDGATLIRTIRKKDQQTAFIVLTGQDGFAEAYSLLKDCLISDFLQKVAATPERLCFALENALERQRLQNDLLQQNELLLKYEVGERKKVEQQRDLLFHAVEQSPTRVLITDRKAKIQYVNKAFETVTGYSKEEALGKTPALLKSGRHDAAFYTDLWKTILSGKTFSAEFINKKKSGALYYEGESIVPIFDDSGEIVQFLAMARDITQARELEMMQQEKLVTLGLVAMGVAHEVNNPNTFVRGNAQTLQFYWKYFGPALEEYAQAHPEIKVGRKDFNFIAQDAPQLLEQMVEGTDRIKKVVDALLVFGHKSDALVATNLQQVMEQACSVNKERLSFLHVLEKDFSTSKEGFPMVTGNPSQLLQVITNLIGNALDSMDETNVKEQEIALRILVEKENYVIQVQDNGSGIDERNLTAIFEPFFTTKAVGKGTGLGLHICSNIIRKHHGEISVHNAPEGGAVFEIQLPRI